ncbi:MAG TPA: phytanoyl-CoA dioxygenase family protein [Caulobacteraceae bacterium]|nr:phytanoyl-CoA dioxygenase family protein [Caulobacteraceae bacterium]
MTDSPDDLFARQPQDVLEVSLGASDVEAFETKGFVSIPRITTDEEVAWLAELYDWLFTQRVQAVKGGHFDLVRPYDSEGEDRLPQLLMPEQRFPQLTKTLFFRNGRKLAAQLMRLDEHLLRGWGHMIRKPARVGEALPWHQDEAYWDPAMVYRALGSWLPLDDATPENGCMSFIPGSHRGEVLPHRHVGDDPRIHALFTTPATADVARAVPVPVAAGGAVFHHSRTLHASGPNRTEKARRAYANEWQLAPVKAETPADRTWIDEGQAAWAARTPA